MKWRQITTNDDKWFKFFKIDQNPENLKFVPTTEENSAVAVTKLKKEIYSVRKFFSFFLQPLKNKGNKDFLF
jgi:hypothetical protein